MNNTETERERNMEMDCNAAELGVIIVDDSEIVRLTCERSFKRAGFEVRSAAGGTEAIEMLRERPARAMLLDLKMPQMTGLELLRLLRQMWPDLEVVIMTAYADSAMVEQARKLGALAVINKPIENIRDLVRIVGMAMVRSSLRQELPVASEPLLRMILIEQGFIGKEEFDNCCTHARMDKSAIRRVLEERGLVTEEEFDDAVADFLEVPRISLAGEAVDPEVMKEFPMYLARKFSCLPVTAGGDAVYVAAADPHCLEAREEIEACLRRPVIMCKADPGEIRAKIEALEAGMVSSLLSPAAITAMLAAKDVSAKQVLLSVFLQKDCEVTLEKALFTPMGRGEYSFSFSGVMKTAAGESRGVSREAKEDDREGSSPDAIQDQGKESGCRN